MSPVRLEEKKTVVPVGTFISESFILNTSYKLIVSFFSKVKSEGIHILRYLYAPEKYVLISLF